jgi:hypothetical protein
MQMQRVTSLLWKKNTFSNTHSSPSNKQVLCVGMQRPRVTSNNIANITKTTLSVASILYVVISFPLILVGANLESYFATNK